MIILVQMILYNLLFLLMVKLGARDNGINVLDRLWVGHSKIWRIKGMEGVPYVKPWKTVLVKRSLGMILYLVVALVIAGLVVLIGKI